MSASGIALIRMLPGGKKVKRCAGCKEDKELAAFTKGTGPGGFHRHCRACCKAYREGVKSYANRERHGHFGAGHS